MVLANLHIFKISYICYYIEVSAYISTDYESGRSHMKKKHSKVTRRITMALSAIMLSE